MKTMKRAFALPLLAACSIGAIAQTDGLGSRVLLAQGDSAQSQHQSGKSTVALDAQREKEATRILLKGLQSLVISAAEAMPADKYSFAPTEGEFKGVRTFAQQVRHLAAANHILAGAALGEEPPADAGDETGPETVRTKTEILDYLNSSFAHLGRAIDAIGETEATVKASPISLLPASKTTRLALTMEALAHTFDHYGQMVEYLRMNGVVPPASRP
jgi:uncharacterized damage-inducible protein DinB